MELNACVKNGAHAIHSVFDTQHGMHERGFTQGRPIASITSNTMHQKQYTSVDGNAIYFMIVDNNFYIYGILPKGPYPPCLRMADRALLAGYPRYVVTRGPFQYKISAYQYKILIMERIRPPDHIMLSETFGVLFSSVTVLVKPVCDILFLPHR